MQDPNIENTVPNRPQRDIEQTVQTTVRRDTDETPAEVEVTQPSNPSAPKPPKIHRWPWVLLGIVLILGGAVFGGWLGYGQAAKIRVEKLTEQKSAIATQHFMAGLVALQNKQYEIAQSQFTYVIQVDPTFPGVQDKLREVMIAMAMDRTPTPAPTVVVPTLTPTLDIRPQEEIFASARQLYANKDWENVIATIDSLRRVDVNFKAVEVDGMLYMAYRFRGIDKILHQANLEGGLYDLALSERFGPLDVDSIGYQTWARMYLNGASFWQIDWVKVMQYFEQIYPYFPNMTDASGITALDRYRLAAKGQGDKLSASGDYCGAYEYYEKSLQAYPDNTLSQKATEVYNKCHPATNTPVPATVAPTVIIQTTVAPTAPAEPTVAQTDTVAPTAESTATTP